MLTSITQFYSPDGSFEVQVSII